MENEETVPALTREDVAERLLYPLFRCLDDSYKKRYVKDIWDQFAGGLRSAAYVETLSEFLEKITKRLPIELQGQYTEPVLSILNAGRDEQVLHWLRYETTYLMLTCRLMNQDRKEFLKMRAEPLGQVPVADLPEVDENAKF